MIHLVARIAVVLALLASPVAAEPVTLRVVAPDGSADELVALVAARLADTHEVRALPLGEAPRELATAIEAFRAADCEAARVEITAAARAVAARPDEDPLRARVALWHAGIAQRCGEAVQAQALAAELVRVHPAVRVDLAEHWPSLAALVDEQRGRVRPGSPAARALLAADRDTARALGRATRTLGGARTVLLLAGEAGRLRAAIDRPGQLAWSPASADPAVIADWLAGALAPTTTTRTFGVQLLAAGRETSLGATAGVRRGSGLGTRLALRPRFGFAELATRLLAYTDAAGDPDSSGGWEWATELRAGLSLPLGDHLTASALGLATLDGQHVDSVMQPLVRQTRVALGVGGRLEGRLGRRLAASSELAYAPLGHVLADAPDMAIAEAPTAVAVRFAVAWRASRAWQLELDYAYETVLFDVRTLDGALASQRDDRMRVGLALRLER